MNAALYTSLEDIYLSFLSIHASTSFSLFIQPHGEMSARYERERKKRRKVNNTDWVSWLQGVFFTSTILWCTLEIPSCVHVLHEWQPNIMHVRKLSQSFTDMFSLLSFGILTVHEKSEVKSYYLSTETIRWKSSINVKWSINMKKLFVSFERESERMPGFSGLVKSCAYFVKCWGRDVYLSTHNKFIFLFPLKIFSQIICTNVCLASFSEKTKRVE